MSEVAPVRVAVVNDYEIVVAGLASMLEPFSDRVTVVELDTGLPVASEVDVVLFDTFATVRGSRIDLEDLVSSSSSPVVVFSWAVDPDVVRDSLERGAAGYLPKDVGVPQLIGAIERVHRGERVVPDLVLAEEVTTGSWPGREHGLTPRESEVLALITQGLSNQEIADQSYLSINSVKTYIRTTYRKVGVTRRAQAVAWGMRNGFEPDRSRSIRALRRD